jgi:glycerol-3-phosphate acyltransferase PlsY
VKVLLPLTVWLAGYDLWEVAVLAALAVLVVLRHAANIRRLVRREEIDLQSGGSVAPSP